MELNITDPSSGGHSLNGMNFTTRDRDNDQWKYYNCAVHNNGNDGGWWYKVCSFIHPNNQYNHSLSAYLNGQWHSLPFIEIKIRPLNCNI